MRHSTRTKRQADRRVFVELAICTLLVTAITLPAALLVRGMSGASGVEAVPLMKVGPVERAARQAVLPPAVHQVVEAPAPASPEPRPGQATAPAAAEPEPQAPRTPQAQATVLEVAPVAEPEVVTFNGRPLRKVKEITMLVTAYSPDERSCGIHADGITASGYSVWTNGMKLVAADTRLLPFGSIVTVPGYNGGDPVPVLDRGGAIKGQRLDVLYPTHEIALKWGAQRLKVGVWEYAD